MCDDYLTTNMSYTINIAQVSLIQKLLLLFRDWSLHGCKLVDILNICVVLAVIIEPGIVPHRDNTPSPGVLHGDGTDVNNFSSINNASSHAIRNQIFNPSMLQNVYGNRYWEYHNYIVPGRGVC